MHKEVPRTPMYLSGSRTSHLTWITHRSLRSEARKPIASMPCQQPPFLLLDACARRSMSCIVRDMASEEPLGKHGQTAEGAV